MKVCPKWNCSNCLVFDEPDLPCATHGLRMVEDNEIRRLYRKAKYNVKKGIEWYKQLR